MIGQSIKDRYAKVKPYLEDSTLSALLKQEFEWLASIILMPNPIIDKSRMVSKAREYGDSELAISINAALNERTIVTSVFQKFEELLMLLEQSIDTEKPLSPRQPESTGILRESHPYKSLWFYNGVRVSSLPQLYGRMKEIDDDTFKEHVNEYRHDVSEWVLNSLHEKTLSKRLRDAKTKEDIMLVIEHALHEKITATLKETEAESQNPYSDNANAENKDVNILDALELPELPHEMMKMLRLKNYDKEREIQREVEIEAEKKRHEEEMRKKAEEEAEREAVSLQKKESYSEDSVIPVAQKTKEADDENFQSFMKVLEEAEKKELEKQDLQLQSKIPGIAKVHSAASSIFVSRHDEDEKASIERYDGVEKKLMEREKTLSLKEKAIEDAEYKIKNLKSHEEEFDMQERLSARKKEVKRLRAEVQEIRRTLSEMHKIEVPFAKKDDDSNSPYAIEKEEMIGLIKSAVSAEKRIEEKAEKKRIITKKPLQEPEESEYAKKERYVAAEERKGIDNEMRKMQSDDKKTITTAPKQNVSIEKAEVIEKTERTGNKEILIKKSLAQSSRDEVFFCKNGAAIGSLKELHTVLKGIDRESFMHHANKSKNDFSIWIEHSLGLPELAVMVNRAKTSNGMRKKIEQWYNKLGIGEEIGVAKRAKVQQPVTARDDTRQKEKTLIIEKKPLSTKEEAKPVKGPPIDEKKPIMAKRKTSDPDEMLEDIQKHIEGDEFDEALRMISSLRKSMRLKNKPKKDELHEKMTEYELKALETDIKILKLKHS